MKNIIIFTLFTLREAFSKKIVITFAAISTFVLLCFAVFFSVVGIDDLVGLDSSGRDARGMVEDIFNFIKMAIVLPLYGGGLFLSIFSASGFIPSMLEKGNAELILSKPLSRMELIIGKFFGGILMVFLNIAYLIVALWILLAIKFGIWAPDFLLTIFTITYAFATLYSLIILIGILTRSSIFAMMISYLIFFILSPVLAARDTITLFTKSEAVSFILDILYYIIPQTSDLGELTTDLAAGGGMGNPDSLYISAIFIILTLGLSIFIFSKKDY
jgi:ABC-type transport system involved in multi-copper enzyme maturation permease subunit